MAVHQFYEFIKRHLMTTLGVIGKYQALIKMKNGLVTQNG